MRIYHGVVEDRNDPLKIGRVRVRVFGIHTHDKNRIATADLAWSHVSMPITTAGMGTLGNVHSLVEGTIVHGLFLNETEDCQEFYVLGVHQVVRHDFIGIEHPRTENNKIKRGVDIGFSDPRRLTKNDYKGTVEGTNPPESPERTHSLSSAVDTSPSRPEFLTIGYDGFENKVTEQNFTEEDLPMYPLRKTGAYSDINLFATGDADYSERDLTIIPLLKDIKRKLKTLTVDAEGAVTYPEEEHTGVKSLAKPIYPYNKATHTESGHVIEVDDTKHNERLAIEHRTGTFYEIDHMGNETHRIVNDSYEVICKDDYVFIGGNANLTVGQGNVVINVDTGNVDLTVAKGNVKADILTGTTDVTSEGKITITGKNTTEIISDTTVTGTLHVTGEQTNDSTIHAKGDISTDAGNAPTLATHKHLSTGQGTGTAKINTSKPDATVG